MSPSPRSANPPPGRSPPRQLPRPAVACAPSRRRPDDRTRRPDRPPRRWSHAVSAAPAAATPRRRQPTLRPTRPGIVQTHVGQSGPRVAGRGACHRSSQRRLNQCRPWTGGRRRLRAGPPTTGKADALVVSVRSGARVPRLPARRPSYQPPATRRRFRECPRGRRCPGHPRPRRLTNARRLRSPPTGRRSPHRLGGGSRAAGRARRPHHRRPRALPIPSRVRPARQWSRLAPRRSGPSPIRRPPHARWRGRQALPAVLRAPPLRRPDKRCPGRQHHRCLQKRWVRLLAFDASADARHRRRQRLGNQRPRTVPPIRARQATAGRRSRGPPPHRPRQGGRHHPHVLRLRRPGARHPPPRRSDQHRPSRAR